MIPHYAQQYGLTPEAYTAAVDMHLRELIGRATVCKRVGLATLELALRSGNFVTMFDAQISGAAPSLALRDTTESKLLRNGAAASDTPHPQYGYLSERPEVASLDVLQHGSVVLRLKPSVRARCSFTFGDSLNVTKGGRQLVLAPQPLAHPSSRAIDFQSAGRSHAPHVLDPLLLQSVDQVRPYVEVQIAGGLRLDDIAEILLSVAPHSDIAALIGQRNIPWRVIQP